MKKQYVLYIDYRAEYKPLTCEYRALEAKNIAEAVIEADNIHDVDTMYLVRIMETCGKVEKVESDIKAQTYNATMEKRSTKWARFEGEHYAKRYISKFGEWFDIV